MLQCRGIAASTGVRCNITSEHSFRQARTICVEHEYCGYHSPVTELRQLYRAEGTPKRTPKKRENTKEDKEVQTELSKEKIEETYQFLGVISELSELEIE